MERSFKQKRAADAFRDRMKRQGYYASTFEEPIDPHGSTRRARSRRRYIVQYERGPSLLNPSKRKVRRRVAKALKKYVRGNRAGERKRHQRMLREGWTPRVKYGHLRARARSLGAKLIPPKTNPPRVKGRKTKGGRAVTLKNFTGTIVKKSDGTVQIVGRGRRK